MDRVVRSGASRFGDKSLLAPVTVEPVVTSGSLPSDASHVPPNEGLQDGAQFEF